MTTENSFIEFYHKLEHALPKSTADERMKWASIIIDRNYDLKELSKLLFENKQISTRFLWLLSDIGGIDSKVLFDELPYLFNLRDKINHLETKASFANYWLLVGVPIQNEAEAITLLFEWLQSNEVNVHTKSRSLFVLFNLTKKYPELKNELKLCLEDQLDKNTPDFNKRANKILVEL